MKQFLRILYSPKATLLLLLIFATTIGIATFIEEFYDTTTARHLIYNARWLEVLLLLLVINLIGNITNYKLYKKEKFPGFIFHLAFIIMIIGAGITRYTGYEGLMHIREGSSTNIIYRAQSYLQIVPLDFQEGKGYNIPISPGNDSYNSFDIKYHSEKKGEVKIKYKGYIKNAVETIIKNVAGGNDIIELIVVFKDKTESVYIESGKVQHIAGLSFAFESDNKNNMFKINEKDGVLFLTTPVNIELIKKDDNEIITENTVIKLSSNYIFRTNDVLFRFQKIYKNAKNQIISEKDENNYPDAIIINFEVDGVEREVPVFGGPEYISNYEEIDVNGLTFKLAYGSQTIKLPFSIYLDDFIVERYPGSNSPSSFTSEVILIDKRNNLKQKHSIFMNNVLDYNGYRFFQSSYDQDEKGTTLSVNHDFIGTWVTYFSYFLLGFGMLLTLFNKNSRFLTLRKKIREIRIQRKTGIIALLIFFSLNSIVHSQSNIKNHISKEHANKFGQLVTQSYAGRFQPVHTLAIDVMHKISRKDEFIIEDKKRMDAMQAFIDMIINQEYWQQQKIIYIREKSVRDIIGISSKYASFIDFFDENYEYKLSKLINNAFRKKKNEQTRFDKEIMKVDERVNICYMVFNGNLLKIFPDRNSENNKWISWDEKTALMPLKGSIEIINQDLKLEKFNYRNILQLYFKEASEASLSGNYSEADKILGYIKSIQRNNNLSEFLPDKSKIKLEVFYNKAQIFIRLKKWYSYLSIILLLLAFIENIKITRSKILTYTLNFFIILLCLAFLYHTFGLGLRWYLSGHAPWSNGYEALLLVSWGGLLAGFCFIRYSKITLAATSLLAFLILMIAGLSSYDPQLTNLQPVLKSYWLIVHVACITISYGFLGLGFILGLINLFFYAFKNESNKIRLNLLIKELTYINEMNLIIGLVLATAGTFLGAVWANESWGRYWGWDAKETWALIILMTYAIILHLRMVPVLRNNYIFNVSSVLGFASVLMTFFGVNYYLSKGLHSYAGGDKPTFPLFVVIIVIFIVGLIIIAGFKEKLQEEKIRNS